MVSNTAPAIELALQGGDSCVDWGNHALAEGFENRFCSSPPTMLELG
jgi:hypothetical protein